MFEPRVKINRARIERVRKCVRLAGFSSVEELVTHALEKELARLEEGLSEEEVQKRLKGLGYIA
jgi:hypothetical protein